MKHYIITNRQIIREAGQERINPDGKEPSADTLRFAEYDDQTRQVLIYPDITDAAINYRATANAGGSVHFFNTLFQEMSISEQNNDTLVYIHGFNTSLQDALDGIHDLKQNYIDNRENPIARIVMFSWPSNDQLLEYRSDRRDAEISGYALGRAYSKFFKFLKQFFHKSDATQSHQPCNCNLHLMCHSMGNYVLERMLRTLIESNSLITTVFKEVILVAADVDWNVMENPRPLYSITRTCERVHLYFHLKDRALTISETTKNSLNRLGKYGPQNIWNIPQHVSVVDASVASGDSPTNHSYHLKDKTVITDISAVLRGERSEDIQKRKFIPHKNIFRLS
jgi:esterase/lipase superfamily enzyme